jgi:hypothetical protein
VFVDGVVVDGVFVDRVLVDGVVDAAAVSARGSVLDPCTPAGSAAATRSAGWVLGGVDAVADNVGSLEADRPGSDSALAIDFSRAAALTERSSVSPTPFEAGALISGVAASTPGSRGTTGSAAGSSEDAAVAAAG